MKHFLFLCTFLLGWHFSQAAPEPSYTELYLNSSVTFYHARTAQNKIFEQQGRYSEANYILDLSKEHLKIPLLTEGQHSQLNAELQFLNSLRNNTSGKSYGKFMAVLYPAYPEGEVERKATIDSIVAFINNFNSRLDNRDSLILFNINYLIANDASSTSIIPSLTSGSALSFWTNDYKRDVAEGNLLACAECNTINGLLAKEFEVVRLQLAKESNGLDYVSFEKDISKHLSNGHLFFISTTSRLFAINIQELHNRYNGKNPLYAFWFKRCEGEGYMFRLYAIRVKLNNNQSTIDNYYLDESFDVDNQFHCLDDPSNTKYIKAVYPEINTKKDIILYSEESPSKYYFDHISNVKNYSAYYLGTLKGNSDCVFSVINAPSSNSGSPTTSTNLPALNNKTKTVGCKLSKDEIVTLNTFIEKHTEINIIVTDEKTVDAYVKDIHPSATTIWINRTEVSPNIYEYEPQNDPGDYSNFWNRWKQIWSYNNLGDSDKPDFKNCFRDVKRSLGYTLDHWHTAATFLSDQLDNLRIPEKYWNQGHPDYSETDSYIRDLLKEIHKKNYINFTTVGATVPFVDFFEVRVISESDQFALFCGIINGALDVIQSIPASIVLITDICRIDYTQLPNTVMEKGMQISTALSHYKSENGEGPYYFIKDAIDIWVDKQNSNTICHHTARVLVNVLTCYAAVIKGTSIGGQVGGSIIKVLATLDKIADAVSPIGWSVKYCKWIYKTGNASLSVVYEYGGKVWMKIEDGMAFIKAKSPIMNSADIVQVPCENLRLYSKANEASLIDKNASDVNPDDIIWVKDPADGQWKQVKGAKPSGSTDPFEEAPLSLVEANKKFLNNISKDYPALSEKLQKQNWDDETLGKFIGDFEPEPSKLNVLNEAGDLDELLAKWKLTGESDIGKLRILIKEANSFLAKYSNLKNYLNDGSVKAYLNNEQLYDFENVLKTADPNVLKLINEFKNIDEFVEIVRGYKDQPQAFKEAIRNYETFNGSHGWLSFWKLTPLMEKSLNTIRRLKNESSIESFGDATDIQLASIHAYTTNGDFINIPYRYHPDWFGIYNKRAIKHINEGLYELRKIPQRKIVNELVYSGKTFSLKDFQNRYVGKTNFIHTYNGYMSTSKSENVAEGFIDLTKQWVSDDGEKVAVILRVISKNGVYIDDISDWGKNLGKINHPSANPKIQIQEEVLLNSEKIKQLSEPIPVIENGVHKTIGGFKLYYVDFVEIL